MIDSIDNYVTRLQLWLRPVPEPARSARTLEVRQHLEELAAEIVANGVGAEEAEGLAVRRFGSAARMGAGLVAQSVRERWAGPDSIMPSAIFSALIMCLLATYTTGQIDQAWGSPPRWMVDLPWRTIITNYDNVQIPFFLVDALFDGLLVGLLFGRPGFKGAVLGVLVWIFLMASPNVLAYTQGNGNVSLLNGDRFIWPTTVVAGIGSSLGFFVRSLALSASGLRADQEIAQHNRRRNTRR